MTDDNDKTIIQAPGSGPVRPMPGGRGGNAPPVPPSPDMAQQPGQVPPPPPPPAPNHVPPSPLGTPGAVPPPPAYGTPQAAPVHRIEIYQGINPVVNAANALLSLIVKLRNAPSHNNVEALYNQVSQELRQFEARLKQEGQRPELVLASRYALCAALDEAVLSTPWGANSAWAQRTLLSAFHNETSGGQKFFLILEKMKEVPAENLNVLELLYYILSFGFEGKYKVVDRGADQLGAIRGDLYHAIRRFRSQSEADLAPDWRQTQGRMSSLVQYIPLWVIASCVAAVMLLTYSGFRFALYNTSTPLSDQLATIQTSEQLQKSSASQATNQ
ncbi:MAG: type IVB secretion system protein IcmH/DotU [Pseudomonadales bacterium]|nr:type IVB secretion system protein IcmH/DotU [Pseudomonadales bacterium]